MAHALSPNLPMPDRRSRAVSLAIGGSVLAHVAIGWIVVASLIARPLPDEAEPLVVEIARPEPLPPPAPPQLKPDEPPPKPEEKPRVRPRPAPVVPEAAPVEALPVPPQPPSAEEGTVTALPQTVPATAPSPTRRFAVAYPARAEAREMAGTATVEVTRPPEVAPTLTMPRGCCARRARSKQSRSACWTGTPPRKPATGTISACSKSSRRTTAISCASTRTRSPPVPPIPSTTR